MLKLLLEALRREPLPVKNLDDVLSFEIYGLLTSDELQRKVEATMRKLWLRNAKAKFEHHVDQESGCVTYSVQVAGEVGFFRRRAATGALRRSVSVRMFTPGLTKTNLDFMPHATWGHGLITETSWKADV
jgi:2'-5' RNA ligase